MSQLPTLYSLDKKGRTKVWSVTVEGAVITVSHGLEGGKITEKVSPPCKGKNIGRANETTPEQQALSEAQSKWNKQIDKDYKEDVKDCGESTLPPLAKKYQDLKGIDCRDYFISTKLNGVRMTAFLKDGKPFFQSRGGKAYPVIQSIADELQSNFWDYSETFVIDGELYCHGMFLEDITSAVKKHNEDTPKIKFHMFDMYCERSPDKHFTTRFDLLEDMFLSSEKEPEYLELVLQYYLTCEEELVDLHQQDVEEGYEGVVLRKRDSLFKWNERSSDFLKYKVALDEEFKCVGMELDKNGGGVPVFEVNLEDGTTEVFKANFKGTHERRKELWDNQGDYIGQHFTVEFESWSKYGIPLKPISIAVREVLDGKPQT